MSKLPFLLAVCLGVAAVATEAAAEEKCQLLEAAELPMSTDISGRVNIPTTIGDHTVKLMIDTGGYVSTLTNYTVKSLGLPSEAAFRPLETYYGGEIVDHFVTAHDVMLGHLKASSLMFFVMSDYRSSYDIGGTWAPSMLSSYDVDFDFANGMFRLFMKDHCEGKVVYWTRDPYGIVSFHLNNGHQIIVPVLLDGKEVRAAIDTGAADTVASFERVEDTLNLDEKSPGMTLVPKLPPGRPRYRYPFKTLTFDDVTVTNPDITLVPDKQSKMSSASETIVLGMNVLRRLHIYIAYGEQKLYVTPATAH